ncbi:glycerol kinase-like [Brassica napus]|uniref:glycerol kinase-like n=1 Tax=Brassica napus TaxID=3708 RepID=UPI002078C1D5|nr:glycerol kinase-like [Brassica napus]
MTGDLAEIRLFCSCTILRLDVLGQETLLNLFLRNYLPYNLYDKAVRIDDLELSNVQERFETFSVNMTHNLIVRLRHKQNLDKATADGHNVDGGLKAIGLTDQRETPSFEANPLDFLSTKLSRLEKELSGVRSHFVESCALPISTYFSAMKLLWLMENVHAVKDAIKKGYAIFGTIDTWLIWNMTGGVNGGLHVTDVTKILRSISISYSRISLTDVAQKLRLNSAYPMADA